ncbi:uncharacterized protein LOC562950 [Danio rerio]|uniref:Si:dkey-7c18.24 n=1 Tax=Danio rerio TaxID=7955 RepID=Q5QNN6_DANRE|nr:uncharacterized protein LOC562950 [Danio rerio]|eukprot:NP_001076301.1 uncharacterized protein LOC562950 [Danio rerio]
MNEIESFETSPDCIYVTSGSSTKSKTSTGSMARSDSVECNTSNKSKTSTGSMARSDSWSVTQAMRKNTLLAAASHKNCVLCDYVTLLGTWNPMVMLEIVTCAHKVNLPSTG